MSPKSENRYKSLVLRLTRSGLAALVLWAGLLLTSLTAFLAYDRANLGAQLRFQETSAEIRAHIESRLEVYIIALRQARSLFHLPTEVDRESFRAVTETIHPAPEYPGLIGIGFAQALRPNDQAGFERKVREEYKNPGLTVWRKSAAPSSADAWAIRYFEPELASTDGQNAVGFVIDSDPRVLSALEEARDSGRATLTRKIELPFSTRQRPAFILALPVFKSGLPHETINERRLALLGFVFTAFDAEEFFEGPVSSSWLENHHVRFSVFEDPVRLDGTPTGPPLYDHPAAHAPSLGSDAGTPRLDTVVTLSPASHPLWLLVETTPGFLSPMDLAVPWIVLLTGSLLSLFLFQILRIHGTQSDRLVKSERQLQLIADSLPVLISYIDAEENFRFSSQAYENWYHVSCDSLLGKPLRSLVLSKTYANLLPFVKRALRGESVSFETELKLPNQESRPVHAEYVPDFASDGSVKGFVALYSDTTEQRRQEERGRFLVELSAVLGASLEIDATLQRLATLLTPSIADWCVIDANEGEGFKRLFAHSHDPRIRKELQVIKPRLLPEDDTHTALLVYRGAEPILINDPQPEILVPSGPNRDEELSAIRRAGCGSVMMVPLKARNHVLGTLTLVSTRPERRFTNDDLAFAVDIARRAALAIDNARLYRETSQANRAKDEFLATLSHELRTPMNVILGWLELLATETFDEETFKQAINTLSRNANLQLQLINDLLDVSKIVNGKVTLNVQKADLAQLIETAVDGFQPAARAKNIKLEVDLHAEDPILFGDPSRIHQVLWNLLSNALKFTPDGGRVSISLKVDERGLEVRVADTGRGIDPRFLPYIFDRFRQEETGSSRSQGGLGLGLSIVRHMMELHGGSIEALSPGKGEGSVFVLRFPQRAAESQISEIYRKPQGIAGGSISPEATASLNGTRVLLVDDSPDVRRLVERILLRAGCSVLQAADAREAWTLLQSGEVDVVVSDLGLPNEDGLSLMKRWRQYERENGLRHLPAAAMTGFVQPEDARRTLEAGYEMHVAKPVTSAALIEAVRELRAFRLRTSENRDSSQNLSL